MTHKRNILNLSIRDVQLCDLACQGGGGRQVKLELGGGQGQ